MTTLAEKDYNAQAAAAVDEAATKALDLVRDLADRDPLTDDMWKNPHDIFTRLDAARTQVLQAWQALQEAVAADSITTTEATSSPQDPNTAATATGAPPLARQDHYDLRAAYMDMITDSFADVLTDLKEKEVLDVDLLVDCLQSGIELWSMEERESFLRENGQGKGEEDDDEEEEDDDDDLENDNEDGDDEQPQLTPHEQRRRELGFHVETTTTTTF